jgi:hypothetical protein
LFGPNDSLSVSLHSLDATLAADDLEILLDEIKPFKKNADLGLDELGYQDGYNE